MKVEYKGAKKPSSKITPLEEQVVYDFLTGKVGFSQALRALGFEKNQPTSLYARISRTVRMWVETSNVVFKKKDY